MYSIYLYTMPLLHLGCNNGHIAMTCETRAIITEDYLMQKLKGNSYQNGIIYHILSKAYYKYQLYHFGTSFLLISPWDNGQYRPHVSVHVIIILPWEDTGISQWFALRFCLQYADIFLCDAINEGINYLQGIIALFNGFLWYTVDYDSHAIHYHPRLTARVIMNCLES